MSVLDINALNELPKVERILQLSETNARLEKLDAEGRVAWALENLPGEYVLFVSLAANFRATGLCGVGLPEG
jgi:phosphoadenosine phosphosulfate reductase